MQIFFGLDVKVGQFSSRGEIRVRRRTLKANWTFKEKALRTSKGSFQEPIQGTMISRSSVTKCLCKSSFVWHLKLTYFLAVLEVHLAKTALKVLLMKIKEKYFGKKHFKKYFEKIFLHKIFRQKNWKNILAKNISKKYFGKKYFEKIFWQKLFQKNILAKNISETYFVQNVQKIF